MHETSNSQSAAEIPDKRYFTIAEVSELCDIKQHVLRYWEQEFPQLKPAKRRGNRCYYQSHDITTIRQIKALLYDQGYTINDARTILEQSQPASSSEDQKSQLIGTVTEELEAIINLLEQ